MLVCRIADLVGSIRNPSYAAESGCFGWIRIRFLNMFEFGTGFQYMVGSGSISSFFSRRSGQFFYEGRIRVFFSKVVSGSSFFTKVGSGFATQTICISWLFALLSRSIDLGINIFWVINAKVNKELGYQINSLMYVRG